MVDLHACFKASGTDTHECDTVAVSLVHVSLNLEYKCGEILREWVYKSCIRHSRKRRVGHLKEVLKEGLDTEVGECGAEEYR